MSLKPNAPRALFGTSKRTGPTPKNAYDVGPGQYESCGSMGLQRVSTRSSNPAFSLSGRLTVSGKCISPGVGKYNPNRSFDSRLGRSPAYSLGRRTISTEPTSEGVGPGAYSPNTSFSHQYLSTTATTPSFSMSSRPKTVSRCRSPGPGAYTLKGSSFSRSPAYSIGGGRSRMSRYKREKGRKCSTPGPGAYRSQKVLGASQPSSRTRSAPSWSIRGRTVLRRHNDVPGPGSYSLESSMGKQVEAGRPSSPGAVMGMFDTREHEDRERSRSPGPGPGKYQSTSTFGARSMYNKHGGHPMGMKVRFGSLLDTAKNVSPGPAYKPDHRGTSTCTKSPAAVMGTSSREGLVDARKSGFPAPGQYQVSVSPIMTTAPAYSLGKRTVNFASAAEARGGKLSGLVISAFGSQVSSVKPSAPRTVIPVSKRFSHSRKASSRSLPPS